MHGNINKHKLILYNYIFYSNPNNLAKYQVSENKY